MSNKLYAGFTEYQDILLTTIRETEEETVEAVKKFYNTDDATSGGTSIGEFYYQGVVSVDRTQVKYVRGWRVKGKKKGE